MELHVDIVVSFIDRQLCEAHVDPNEYQSIRINDVNLIRDSLNYIFIQMVDICRSYHEQVILQVARSMVQSRVVVKLPVYEMVGEQVLLGVDS